MAKKNIPATKPVSQPTPVVTSPVRNSSVPPKAVAAPARREVTSEDIAKRAYEIWQSGQGGSEHDNWVRAERELRGA